MKIFLSFSFLFLILLSGVVSCNQPEEKNKKEIKLVLQITVDGLRGDLIDRYKSEFIAGGFQYLLKSGTYYSNAHYQHANTETIVGHTTLATGTTPSNHGMVGNVWFDAVSGEIAYNIEDPDAPLLPTRTTETKGIQIDPAQKAARTSGRSPRAILANTFSDELYNSTHGKAKIFGVSGKDRGAVSMAGHHGRAYWYSTDNGDFVSSQFYLTAYPSWVKNWNGKRKAERYAGQYWNLLNELSSYQFKDQDDRPYEVDLKGYGKVFPHQFGEIGNPLLFTQILVSPKGDELLLDFAKELVQAEEIGKDGITDYLAISFSGVDAINHFFGPSSLENEDVVLQLDRTLKDLFEFIEKSVGLDHTLIVLSADHGMAEMPEYMNEQGLEVGRIYSEDIVNLTNQIGKKQFNLDAIAKSFFRPSLYLDTDLIKNSGLDLNQVEDLIAQELSKVKGISIALSKSQIQMPTSDPTHIKIKNNYEENRSGNIYVAQEPYWFLFEKGPIGVMHGSPWEYDTYVPIIFSGPGIDQETVNRLVHPSDLAPTLSSYLNINPPASSTGKILNEIKN
jgi:predicted AlkP superfamily pyrophosphatase or phosphodiesterase